MFTKEEEKWVKRIQRALNDCPSSRLGFYTTGDCEVSIYDLEKSDEIDCYYELHSRSDFCSAVDEADAHLGELAFPQQVHSTAG